MGLRLLMLSAACLACVLAWSTPNDKMLLQDVPTLVLYKGRMTNARRAIAVPQIKCVGGECGAVSVDFMECKNMGSAGTNNIQWKCTAFPEMSTDFSLGSVQVGCEGYDHKGDPYVLAGSCGVEYTVKRNPNSQSNSGGYQNQHHSNQNQHQYNKRPQQTHHHASSSDYPNYYDSGASGDSFWKWYLFIILAGLIGYYMFLAPETDRQHAQPGRTTGGSYFSGGGGGGSGGGGGYGGGSDGGFRNRGAGTYTQYQQQQQTPPPQTGHGGGGGGGWFSSFLPGAALGYLFGNYNRPTYANPTNTRANPYGMGTGYSSNTGAGGSYTSNGDGGARPQHSSNTSTHSSTAFGGTSNR